MAGRALRFGVSVFDASSAEDWRAIARRAESLGYDTLSVADHVTEMLSPFTALAAAAEATTRLRLGTLVLNNDLRHPVLVAREVATLDLLSDGRVELGLGAGHMEGEYRSLGIDFDSPRERVSRLEEAVAILRPLLAGETVDFEGEHYRLRGQRVYPHPTQRPLPLMVGGNGRRVLRLGGRMADIVSITGFGPTADGSGVELTHFSQAGLAQQVAVVREAAGARANDVEINILVQGVVLSGDPRATAEELEPRFQGLSADEILECPFFLVGSAHGLAERLLGLRAEVGANYFTVFAKDMEPMAEVMSQVRAS